MDIYALPCTVCFFKSTDLLSRAGQAGQLEHGSSSSLGGNVITVAVAQGSPAAAAAAVAAATKTAAEAAPSGQGRL